MEADQKNRLGGWLEETGLGKRLCSLGLGKGAWGCGLKWRVWEKTSRR